MTFKLDSIYKNKAGIYEIHQKDTGRVYIGGSIDLYNRILNHYYYLKNNKHRCQRMQQDANLYGLDSFMIDVIELVSPEDIEYLRIRERYWMEYYQFLGATYNNTTPRNGQIIDKQGHEKIRKTRKYKIHY